MEVKNTGENIEQAENSHPDIPLRSDSASATSVASAISDLSFDELLLDREENGSFALDAEQSEQRLLQQGMTTSDTSDAPELNQGSASTLESPPAQVMERPSDPSAYRIPSYVFARNKSNTPNPEWSTCSNESLFSIHTGNMSFTRDQFSWLLKSGELGMYGPGDIRKSGELGTYGDLGKINDLRKSGELPPPSSKIVHKPEEPKNVVDVCKPGEQVPASTTPDVPKSGEHIIAAHFNTTASSSSPSAAASKPADVAVTTPSAASDTTSPDSTSGIRKDDLKSATKKGRKASIEEVPLSTSVSHHSDASGQSFAFPVLGEIDREKSVNSGTSRVDHVKDSSPTSNQEGQSTPKSSTEAAPASSSCFSCFSCCFCC